jgi:hypothetical protein
MALTKDDLQAIGGVVEQTIRQSEQRLEAQMDAQMDAKIQASEKRLIAAMDERFTQQAAYLSRAIGDSVKVMAETYATKERVDDLEDEVGELRKELNDLKQRFASA